MAAREYIERYFARYKGVAEFIERTLLGQVAHRAGTQYPIHRGGVGARREGDDVRRGGSRHDLPRRLDTIGPRHADIHDHDVGRQARGVMATIKPRLSCSLRLVTAEPHPGPKFSLRTQRLSAEQAASTDQFRR